MAKLRSVITAYQAVENRSVAGAIDIGAAFDNVIQPLFPYPMPNLAIVMNFEELEAPTKFEVRINAPDDELVTKGEFEVILDPFGYGKKILNLEKFVVDKRGKYTMDVFEKAEDKLHFVKTEDLFIAEYPPQRKFSTEEIEKIMSDDNLIKTVKTEFRPLGAERNIKIQVNLDKKAPVEADYLKIPDNDMLIIDGKEYDMTGIRRQIEWLFGQPRPKKQEESK